MTADISQQVLEILLNVQEELRSFKAEVADRFEEVDLQLGALRQTQLEDSQALNSVLMDTVRRVRSLEKS